MSLTFVRAVPEGAGAADGPRPVLQGGGAAAQRVSLPVQVEGVLGGYAVGAAHAAAAWRQVVLADVSGAHCTEGRENCFIPVDGASQIGWIGSDAGRTQVGVVVFAGGCARSAWRRQRRLAARVLKPPGGMGPQPLLAFLVGGLSGRRRVPEPHDHIRNVKRCHLSGCEQKNNSHAATPQMLTRTPLQTPATYCTRIQLWLKASEHPAARLFSPPAPKWLSGRRPSYRRRDNRPYLILRG